MRDKIWEPGPWLAIVVERQNPIVPIPRNPRHKDRRVTYIQVFTGGQPIDPAALAAAGVHEQFSGDVTDWVAPPAAPKINGPIKAADMPPSIRGVLAKAMCKAIEQATGFKVDIKA